MIVIDNNLLAELRGRTCEMCGKRPGVAHHCRHRGIGGGSRLDVMINLCVLCYVCHDHYGGGLKNKTLALIAKREGLTPEEVEDEINRLLRLPKPF